jgi:hypothetical protein
MGSPVFWLPEVTVVPEGFVDVCWYWREPVVWPLLVLELLEELYELLEKVDDC